MLLTNAELEGIRSGKIDRTFRTWKRATVKTGGTLVTRAGLLAIDEAAPIERKELDEFEARRAGFESLEKLFERVDCGREGRIYRIRLHYAGPDPRIALRNDDQLTESVVEQLRQKLARLDAHSANGPWTERFLRTLATSEGVPAIELAQTLGYEKDWLKSNVRKLKALGLTESLQPGYRLSPRGEALLAALDREATSVGGQRS